MHACRRPLALLFVCFWPALVSVSACKANTIDNETNNKNVVASNIVGASGGIVLGPEGASLRIPAGALTQDTRISISVAEPAEYPALGNYEVAGKVFAFEPHGQKFFTSVIVSLPVPTGSSNLGAIHAEDHGSWSAVPANVGQANAEVATATFSYFALTKATAVGPQAEAGAPLDAGSDAGGDAGTP